MRLSQCSFPPVEYCPINIASRPESLLLFLRPALMSNGAKEPISQCQAKVAAADIKINDVVRPISSRQLEPQRDIFFRGIFEKL